MKKVCKPNFRMDYFQGCGKKKPVFKYGSCQSCFILWTQTTDNGKKWLKKQTKYKLQEKEKEKRIERKKESRQMKVDAMSTTEYWSKELQPKINEICRIIDNGHPCIATENYGKMNAGHYIAVGSNRTLSLNLHNLFIQSFESNHWKSGDNLKYQSGIRRVFGDDYFDFVDSLAKCPPIKPTKEDLIEWRSMAMEIIKELKKREYFMLPPEKRIELRNQLNISLGIYKTEYCVFGF